MDILLTMDEPNQIMQLRNRLHDVLQEELKKLDDNEHSLLTGWVVLVECVAPGNKAGTSNGLYAFSSDATGAGDQTPWGVHGYLAFALMNFEEMFYVGPDDEEEGTNGD